MPDLSVVVPARNEEWLKLTVEDVLRRSEADTEVIVILDGAWAAPPLDQHPKLQVVYLPESIGQRAATNLGARISTARYICKLDAHCSVADGWDVALIEAAKGLGPNVVQIPAQKNLHVYDQVCEACGGRFDQAPALQACKVCGGTLRKDVVWQPRVRPTTTAWRFDSELHFQYDSNKRQHGDLPETMSCLGACWFVDREWYLSLGGLDEDHGSWGQMGTELACKAWLSGGRMVTNRRTWYAHFFRVGGIGFPYEMHHRDQEYARQYSRNLWRGNNWPGQIRPLRWLVEKFWPVAGWTQEQLDGLESEERFRARVGVGRVGGRREEHPEIAPVAPSGETHRGRHAGTVRRGVIYYSDCRPDPAILEASRVTIERSGLPIVAVTLSPIRWPSARNIVLPLERGYLAMFKQILAGLEALDADVVFFCEHDVLYHLSHFQFRPEHRDKVYYNQNVWKVSAQDGRALHYRCSQTSGLVGYRDVLIEHYRKRVAIVEERGFSRRMGFEPGTHGRPERVDDMTHETWMSEFPNIDIRHDVNLTPSRWRREEFRNQKYTAGWTESDRVPGWGVTLGRMPELLSSIVGVSAVA